MGRAGRRPIKLSITETAVARSDQLIPKRHAECSRMPALGQAWAEMGRNGSKIAFSSIRTQVNKPHFPPPGSRPTPLNEIRVRKDAPCGENNGAGDDTKRVSPRARST